ncbi:MAG: HlyD family efflux transporter periplasmic adaptor subunit [Gemmatimonadaceae bacterium]|nr:HlyD family efflux transporter periplasmic adaptor subunit [Acetobacteraceae bacterium]
MNRRVWIGAGVGSLLALGGGGYVTSGFGLWPATRAAELTLFGNVDIREVNLGFRVAGRIASMPLDEGMRVIPGTLLAELDPHPLATRLASADGRIASARAEFAKRVAGNRPQEIAVAEADIAQRLAMRIGASLEFERKRKLVALGDVPRAQLDDAKATFDAAQAALSSSIQTLSLQNAGSRIEDVDAARANLDIAIADRDTAQTDLDDARLLAPSAGVILTRAREPGAIVGAGETLFTLTIDRPMRVRAYVTEPELGRVRPGAAVTVHTDGGGRSYQGTIGFISPTAEFTPKTVETKSLRADLVYRLRIIVTDPDEDLRQGQPVTVVVPLAATAANATGAAATPGER